MRRRFFPSIPRRARRAALLPVAALAAALHAPRAGRTQDGGGQAPHAAADTLLPGAALQADVDLLARAEEALHPGLYRYQTPAAWRARVAALRREVATGMGPRAFYGRLAELTAAIRCGHSYPNFFNQSAAVRARVLDAGRRLPFLFRWAGDTLVVVRDLTPPAPGGGALRPGTRVLAIDGVPAARVLARLLPLRSGPLRPAGDVSAAGRDAVLAVGTWVHLSAGASAGGALLIVGWCGAQRARFNEADARVLGAMLRPAFIAGARDARARWGPCWAALGDASRPIAGGPDAADPGTAPSSEPSSGIATTLGSCDDARFASVSGNTGAPVFPLTLAAAHLTAREHEIAALLAQRRTNREIAEALTITEHTARHHTERVLRKLGLSTRRDVPRR